MTTESKSSLVALAVAFIFLLTNHLLGAGQQAYLKPVPAAVAGQWFGSAVAVSGDIAVVGAHGEHSPGSNYTGAAYVYARTGHNWNFQARLRPDSLKEYEHFGEAVAIWHDTLVVGAERGAYVYVRNGTNWLQQAYLQASNTNADGFGRTVAISSNTVAIGAMFEDAASLLNSGAAYVFVRNGTNWSQQAYLQAANPGAQDFFGNRVAVSDDTLVVGAYLEDSAATGINGNQNDNSASDAGAAYVFVRSGTNWTQQAYLKASNTGTNDQFGSSVAIFGDTAVIGAPLEDSNARVINGNQTNNTAFQSGAAYVFARNGTNWNQQAYLKSRNSDGGFAPGLGGGDAFGCDVAVSGDLVLIGAAGEASNGMGLDRSPGNNSASSAGAAYTFVRSGAQWTQQNYLKASNPGSSDIFGSFVALSGDTAVIGAYYEDSNANGVNGNQNDNSLSEAGAAYVVSGLGLGVFPDGSGGYSIRFKDSPAITNRMERAPTVSGPWTTMATNIATDLGIISVHDTNAPSDRAFYRTSRP